MQFDAMHSLCRCSVMIIYGGGTDVCPDHTTILSAKHEAGGYKEAFTPHASMCQHALYFRITCSSITTRLWLGHPPELPQASRALLASQCTIMCHSLDCRCVVTKRLRTAIASQRSWYIPPPSIWYCDIRNHLIVSRCTQTHVLLRIPGVLIPSYCAHSGPSQHSWAVLEIAIAGCAQASHATAVHLRWRSDVRA